MRSAFPRLLLALVLGVAAGARLWRLDDRPMHADEANQAVKFGSLLEYGRYAYDPREHHGPTLYYATLIPAWLRGQRTLASLDETTVRLTPAIFGIAAVLLTAALAAPLGRFPALAAAALVAVSPPAIYYSRDFIQETLLCAFTLGALVCGQRWWRTGRVPWALAMGVCGGLMQATKETAPLFAAAAFLALAATFGLPGDISHARERMRQLRSAVVLALAAALCVAVFLYSSFFSHPAGLLAALSTYSTMTTRALQGAGQEKPWWYYLSLFGHRRIGGYAWDETLFLALSVAGVLVAVRSSSSLLRRAALFTILVSGILSLTPYKTPWLVVNLVPMMSILAAGALAALARQGRFGLGVASALFAAAVCLQAWQAWRAVFLLPADSRNPFAYVQSPPDVKEAEEIAAAAKPGPIKVIGREYWPLPWYLRRRPAVGYWSSPPADCDGPVVFADADISEAVSERLHGPYKESYIGLRPGVLMVVFSRAR